MVVASRVVVGCGGSWVVVGDGGKSLTLGRGRMVRNMVGCNKEM